VNIKKQDVLIIGGKEITNRLFVGTGKFGDFNTMKAAIEACGSEVVTVALRRVNMDDKQDNVLEFVPKNCILMPNTSGARNAEEAIRIARLSKAAGCGNWIKIEVINDNKYLMPDNEETTRAVKVLAAEGFVVLPYMSPDLTAAKRMRDAGAAAIMPLGSPIGSNRGFKTAELVRLLVNEINLPIIVDAGLAQASDAAQCMELGCAGVLVNTAIATAKDPVSMAKAFDLAVKAGRLSYLASSNQTSFDAQASSPLTGFLHNDK
jgi:thiazole synthase